MADVRGDEVKGGPEYYAAWEVLRARQEGAQQGNSEEPGATMQALQLVHTVLNRTDGRDAAPGSEAPGPAELLAALVALRHLREEVASWEPRLIAAARGHGVSWAALAPALGVTSRQAAERRYLRLRPSTDRELTGEERVQAERTKRAGDRAVARWARQNSASLRRLAGQVSALGGLTASGQYHADRVHQALADDDAATLLLPLADAHDHLRASHATLAEQINMITEHAEHLRRDTHERRQRQT